LAFGSGKIFSSWHIGDSPGVGYTTSARANPIQLADASPEGIPLQS
jgi:hypothetical protein